MSWPVPTFLANTLQFAGQMAIPMMLMTLGVAIAKLNVRGLGRALALSLFKVALCAGAAVAVAEISGLTGVARSALIVQAVTPVAITNYLLAERYQTDPTAVAGLVVVSTLISIGVIPVVLALLI